MTKKIILFGLLLILMGLSTMVLFSERDPRLLTPLALGGILIPLGGMIRNQSFRPIGLHGSAMVALIGFIFNIGSISFLWEGTGTASDLHAAVIKSLTAVILLILLLLIVNHLKAERLAREAEEESKEEGDVD